MKATHDTEISLINSILENTFGWQGGKTAFPSNVMHAKVTQQQIFWRFTYS